MRIARLDCQCTCVPPLSHYTTDGTAPVTCLLQLGASELHANQKFNHGLRNIPGSVTPDMTISVPLP